MVSTIAVGIDGSETSEKAADFAIELAERFGAKLIFVNAYNQWRGHEYMGQAPLVPVLPGNAADEAQELLRAAVERAASRGVAATSTCSDGDAASVLVEVAENNDVDILVVGNRGMQRRVLGSVPNSVTHRAKCSVYVVKTT